MGSMAKITIIGNLGRDSELKYVGGSNTPVLEFSVATNESWNDRSGNRVEHSQWFRVSLCGKRAEPLKPYLLKGKQVYVEGTLRTREYDDREGNKRFSLDVRANEIVLLGGRGEGGQGGQASAPGELGGEDRSFNDGDIPF